MRSLVILLVLVCSVTYGQDFDFDKYGRSPLDKWSEPSRSLGTVNGNRFDTNSLSNPFGAGSRFKSDGINNPYSRYGSPYSSQSANNPYAANPPKIYSADGRYHGELSKNRFSPDSTSNPYGRYGSPYSPDSINNPYGAGNPYRSRDLRVYPGYLSKRASTND